MNMHKAYLLLISILFGVSIGIFLSVCINGFYSFYIVVQIILISSFIFLGWFICRLAFVQIKNQDSFSANTRIKIGLLAILSLMLTLFLGINYINQTIYLPPVKMKISLSKDNPNHVPRPQMQLDAIRLNNEAFDVRDAQISAGCKGIASGFASSGTEDCYLTFFVDISREADLQLEFMKSQSAGVVEFTLRSIVEKIDLYQETTNKYEHQIKIGPDLASKRIRFPLVGISLFAIFGMIFLTLTFLDATVLRFLDRNDTLKSTLWLRVATILVYSSFVLGAFLYTSGWLGNHPISFVNLDSDAANIASFSAAYDHPENFLRDPFLSDTANFKSYFAFHIPLIRTLSKIVGTYSGAFAVLLFPTIVLQLIGFYHLGLTLFKYPYIAFLFTWVLAFPVKMPVLEFFGVSLDVIPRFLFQAILPFMLILIVTKVDHRKLWWVGALLISASLYIHPVSGPAWLVVYFMSIIFICKGKSSATWWLNYIGAALIAILGLIPFIVGFFGSSNSDSYNMTLLREITLERLPSQTETMGTLYWGYLTTNVLENWTMMVLWGISLLFIGFALISIMGLGPKTWKTIMNGSERVPLLLFSWWISILLVGVVLPLVDEIYVQKTGNIQILREIRRTLRYYIPLLWMTFFWIIVKISNKIKSLSGLEIKRIQLYGEMIILSFSLLYIGNLKPLDNNAISNEISCNKRGYIICEVPGNEKEKIEFYDQVTAIVHKDELIFPDPSPDYMRDSLIPRYYNLRSIAYTYKDGGSTGNTSMEFIENWWIITNEIAPYLPNTDHPLDLAVLDIARKIGSDYFILVKTANSDLKSLNQNRIVFQNEYAILYSLQD